MCVCVCVSLVQDEKYTTMPAKYKRILSSISIAIISLSRAVCLLKKDGYMYKVNDSERQNTSENAKSEQREN